MKTALFLLLLSAHADDQAVDHALKSSANIYTKETIVEGDGVRYRRVEYSGSTYYLKLLESEQTHPDLQVLCEKQGQLPINQPAKIYGEAQVFKRTAVFVETLKDACGNDQSGRKLLTIEPSVAVGLRLKDTPKSFIKSRKIYVSPEGVGVKGEF